MTNFPIATDIVQDLIAFMCPPAYKDRAFVAGGYAACAELAQDIDLWIPVPEHRVLSQERELIYTWLRGHCHLEGLVEQHTSEARGIDGDYDHRSITVATQRVGVVPFVPLPVHVMVTTGNVYAVLETFDISTHQVAINADGDRIFGQQFTNLTKAPVQLRDTPTTETRMQKITARYAHFRQEAPVASH